jgi:hypothetical protein
VIQHQTICFGRMWTCWKGTVTPQPPADRKIGTNHAIPETPLQRVSSYGSHRVEIEPKALSWTPAREIVTTGSVVCWKKHILKTVVMKRVRNPDHDAENADSLTCRGAVSVR